MKAPAWVKRVEEATAPANKEKYFFDWKEGVRRVNFIEGVCRYPEGSKAGQLIQLEDWQKEQIIYPTFGWKKKSDGLRRFRKVFIFIPRKNAKTTLIACVGLSVLFQDKEAGAQMFCLGSVKEQSAIIYRIMRQMIEAQPELLEMLNVKASEFQYPDTNSFVKVLANSPGKHGLNAHAVFVDELHEFLLPRHVEAYEAIVTSMISRSQPIEFLMTTAGYDTNSICYDEYLFAKDLISGKIVDDTYLPLVFEAGHNADWHDKDVWQRANPGLGGIIPRENFEHEYEKACQRPSTINTFKRLHLNMWANALESWIVDRVWMEAKSDFVAEDVAHLPCWCGLDLASVHDLNAFATLWVDIPNWNFYLKVHHFVNEEKARSHTAGRGVDYLSFEDEGSCTLTEGNVTDHKSIEKHIMKFSETNDIRTVAYDRAHSTYIVSGLIEKDIQCEEFAQSAMHMSYPTKQFEIEINNGNMVHDGSDCMRWEMGCVVIKRYEDENIKITKKMGDQSKKVDGPVAAVMAFGQFVREHGEREVEPSFTVIGLD